MVSSVSLDLIRALRPVVQEIRSFNAVAAYEVVQVASGIAHHIDDGERCYGQDPRWFFALAHRSAVELRGLLQASEARGWVICSEEVRALLQRELRLLHGLTTRRKAVRSAPARLRKERRTGAPSKPPAYLPCSWPPTEAAEEEIEDKPRRVWGRSNRSAQRGRQHR